MGYVDFIVNWLPTCIFLLILIIGFIRGAIRGYRKSVISLIHNIIAAVISVGVFLLVTNLTYFDNLFLTLINQNFPNFLTEFGVPSTVVSFREALLIIIPKLINEVDPSIASALASNSGYVLGLVNLVLNLIFSIISVIIFFILKLILHIIYLIFYSETKYKNKVNNDFKNGKRKTGYKKYAFKGAFFNLIGSFLIALVCFSFVGNVLYVSAGSGDGTLPEHTFESEQTNDAYEILEKIDNYGNTGIFGVLNLIKDSNGIPLYLYISSGVFSGDYVNPQTGVSEKVILTHELGNYTRFIKDVASVVVSYDNGTIDHLIEGTQEFSTDVLVDYFSNESFRNDLREVISNYSGKSSFISDFVMSMVDSYAQKIDQSPLADSFSPEVKDIMCILFVEGYKSQNIEYEKNYTGNDLPFVKPSYLINQSDLVVAFDLFSELVNKGLFEENVDYVDLALSVAPYVHNLHMFTDANKNRTTINGVMGRIYSYVEQQLLNVAPENAFAHYSDNSNINWIDELNHLVDVAPDVNNLYQKIEDGQQNSKNISQIVSEIVNDNKLLASYDKILDFISNSKVGATVLSEDFVNDFIVDSIKTTLPEFEMPENVVYANSYDNNGNLIKHGELYDLLSAVRNLAVHPNGVEFLEQITREGADVVASLKTGKGAFVSKNSYDNMSVIDYVLDSKLLHSITSAFLINLSNQPDAIIYVSDSAKDSSGLIKKSEINLLFNNLFEVIDVIPDGFDFSQPYAVSKLLKANGNLFINQPINLLLSESLVLQGTIANLIIRLDSSGDLGSNYISLAPSLQTPEGWLKTSETQSELYVAFTAMRNILSDTRNLADVDESFINTLVDMLCQDQNIEALYSSSFLKYSFSNILIDVLYDCGMFDSSIIDDCINEQVVKIEEAKALIKTVSFLSLDLANGDFSAVNQYVEDLSKVVKKRVDDSSFDGYSLLNVAYTSAIFKDFLNEKIDNGLVGLIDQNKLNSIKVDDYYTLEELEYFINSLVDLNLTQIANANGEQLWEENVYDHFTNLNESSSVDSSITKLDYLHNSNVLRLLIAETIDEIIESNPSTLQFYDQTKEELGVTGNYVYIKEEISSIVSLLRLIDEDSLTSIDLTTLKLSDLKENFFNQEKQVTSKFLLSALSKNIDNIAGNQLIVPNSAYLSNTSNLVIIKDAELYQILDFSQVIFGDNATVNDVDSDMNTSINNMELVDISNAHLLSDIIRATLTNVIVDIPSLKVPKIAFEEKEVYSIFASELEHIVDVCEDLGVIYVADLDNVVAEKVDHISLNQAYSYVARSYIIQSTVSTEMIESGGMIIPTFDFDSEQNAMVEIASQDSLGVYSICLNELRYLFNALYTIGIVEIGQAYNLQVDHINPSSYYTDTAKVEVIANSSILRATITEHLSLGDSNDLIAKLDEVVYGDNVTSITDTSTKIAILKDYEIEHLLCDIGLFNDDEKGYSTGGSNPFKCSLTYELIIQIYQSGDLHLMLQSDIFRLGVSQILYSKGLITTQNIIDVYIINLHDATQQSPSLEDWEIEEFFENHVPMIPA